MNVDQIDYGDGYVHRSTRGLNPARPTWSLMFPFIGLQEATDMYSFLFSYAVPGFYFTPPELWPSEQYAFVYVDEWSFTIVDKSRTQGIIGNFNVAFVKCFNPQPTPSVLAAIPAAEPLASPFVPSPPISTLKMIEAPLFTPTGIILPRPRTLPLIPYSPTDSNR